MGCRTYESVTTTAEMILGSALTRQRIPAQHHAHRLGYEIDFLVGGRVAVEVDGFWHLDPEVRAWDEVKTAALGAAGYTVLRFSNQEIHTSLRAVCETIQRELENHRFNRLLPFDGPMAPWQVALWQGFQSA